MPTLKAVTPLTHQRFLNLYQADYQLENGDQLPYFIASRREISPENLTSTQSDAVTIFAVDQTGQYFLMVKEFRYPINQEAYSVPSGLIDPGEDASRAALRELQEETGYTDVQILKVLPSTYSSVGMTNERVTPVIARINREKSGSQALEASEQIESFWVDKQEALEIALNHQQLTARTQLALLLFAKNQLTDI